MKAVVQRESMYLALKGMACYLHWSINLLAVQYCNEAVSCAIPTAANVYQSEHPAKLTNDFSLSSLIINHSAYKM